jgi:hypothetical protein
MSTKMFFLLILLLLFIFLDGYWGWFIYIFTCNYVNSCKNM